MIVLLGVWRLYFVSGECIVIGGIFIEISISPQALLPTVYMGSHMASAPALSMDEIKQRQHIQQQQQRLERPIDAQAFSCLRDARLYLRGYSELRQVASWLHEALRCKGAGLTAMDECQRAQTPSGSAFPPADSYRNLSTCREQLYSRQPYRSACSTHNVSMHFEWK